MVEAEKKNCNDRKCKTCEGTNCNKKKDFQKCITCSSRDSDKCSYNTSQIWEQCENYMSSCLTGIDAHGYTHRRCSKDPEQDNLEFPNNQIQVCTPNLCNKNTFPPDRLQCYVCKGEDGCDFMPAKNELNKTNGELKPCAYLLEDDECYAFIDRSNYKIQFIYIIIDKMYSLLLWEKNGWLTLTVSP